MFFIFCLILFNLGLIQGTKYTGINKIVFLTLSMLCIYNEISNTVIASTRTYKIHAANRWKITTDLVYSTITFNLAPCLLRIAGMTACVTKLSLQLKQRITCLISNIILMFAIARHWNKQLIGLNVIFVFSLG